MIVSAVQIIRLCYQPEETAKHIVVDCERLDALFGYQNTRDESDASIGKTLLGHGHWLTQLTFKGHTIIFG